MKLTRTLMKKIRTAGISFLRKLRSEPNMRFANNAYYLYMQTQHGSGLLSMTPYYG